MRRLASIAIILAASCAAAASGANDELQRQRALFQEAYEAGLAGNAARFEARVGQLRDYVLYPYLEYARLLGDIRDARAEQVAAFLERHDGEPLEWRLRDPWLRELARRGDWQAYLSFYRPAADVTLRCHHATARLRTGDSGGLAGEALALWLSPVSVTDVCDPVFEWLYRTGRVDAPTRFQRVALAMEAGNSGLASWLARDLDGEHRQWYQRWRATSQDPAAALGQAVQWQDGETARRIASHGLRLLARGDDGGRAWDAWLLLDAALAFPEPARAELIRHLALDAATDYHPEAARRLDAVPEAFADERVHAWRVRTPLKARDWPATLAALEGLPEPMQAEPRWRYWRARSLEASGRIQQAFALYAELAREAEYHGFLAADRLGGRYPLREEPLATDQDRQRALGSVPAMARALELHHVGMDLSARREWHHALAGADAGTLRQAALLAAREEWHDRAVWALAQTGDRRAYELRFPLAFKTEIRRNAGARGLDQAWVYALVRAESGFITDAHSPAGARGLMQVMPGTGRELSRELGQVWRGATSLSAAGVNVSLGTAYLKRMLERFDDDMVLATAAYNAGPHNVERWVRANPPRATEIWTETLPFHETREYVQRVLAYTVVYDWRLDGQVTPLSARLPDPGPTLAFGSLCWWPLLTYCR